VVLKLNGGLGTSMGLEKAKSLLPVKGDAEGPASLPPGPPRSRSRVVQNFIPEKSGMYFEFE